MSTVTLHWTLPTLCADGSALAPADITETQVFDSAFPGGPIGTASGPTTSFQTGVLSVGAHVFTVVVHDATGGSAPSNEASFDIVGSVPAPVTDLAGTINP